MYVITHHNKIILGPIDWNASFIASVLQNDLDLNERPTVLPSDIFKVPYYIIPEVYVRQVQMIKPEYNTKIQKLGGVEWRFDEKYGYASYNIIDKEIDEVKGELKNLVASKRWEKEQQGTSVTINGSVLNISTLRDERRVFLDKYAALQDGQSCTWKFPESWVELTKNDLFTIISSIEQTVQAAFDWEIEKQLEIENCTTLDQLNLIDLDV